MSGLKKGTRVTALTNRSHQHARREYVLDEDLTRVRYGDIVRVLKDEGGRTQVWADTVEPVVPEPAFKRGDRVRVTSVVEAVVTDVHPNGFVVEGPHYYDRAPENETRTVEVLDPEPLKPGTVGILGGFLLYVVDENGSKATDLRDGHQFDNPSVGGRSLATDRTFRVLHEPQAND